MASNNPQEITTIPMESVEASEPELPFLPPEVQLSIIQMVTDGQLPEAWCSFRLVNRAWKEEIEKVVRQRYLNTTTISLHVNSFEYTMKFDRLSEDKNNAIFKVSGRAERYFSYWTTQTLNPQEAALGEKFHLVTIPEVACSDPKLDGIEIDFEQKVLSIPWMPMINQVLVDELHIRHRADNILNSGKQDDQQLPSYYWGIKRISLLQFAPNWNTNIASRGMLLYMINRSEPFMIEIERVRRPRLRRQYALNWDQAITGLGYRQRAKGIFTKRNEFRSTRMI